jgi:hypothetical protein
MARARRRFGNARLHRLAIHAACQSGRGPPQSTTLARSPRARSVAERPGVLQPSGAVAQDRSCQPARPFPMARARRRFGNARPHRLAIRASFHSGGGPPQSRTLARLLQPAQSRSVLECSSPLELWPKTYLANQHARSQWHVRIEAGPSPRYSFAHGSGRRCPKGG